MFDRQAAPRCQSINLSIARSGLELLGLSASVLLVYFLLIFNYHNTQVGIWIRCTAPIKVNFVMSVGLTPLVKLLRFARAARAERDFLIDYNDLTIGRRWQKWGKQACLRTGSMTAHLSLSPSSVERESALLKVSPWTSLTLVPLRVYFLSLSGF